MKRNKLTIQLILAIFTLSVAGTISAFRNHTDFEIEVPSSGNSIPTSATGEDAARRDLKNGIRKIVLYGLIYDSQTITERLRMFGYEWQSGGCIIGDAEYEFWSSYNRVMIDAGKRQFGNPFAAIVQTD